MLGRLESIAYEIMALPLVYLVGKAAFGTTAGLAGAWLTALLPMVVAHAQVVRDDSAGVFFGMLSLLLCLRVCKHPTRSAVVVAGFSVGLAIATRYFMVALVPTLLLSVVIGQRSVIAEPLRPEPQNGQIFAFVYWKTQLLALLWVGLGFAFASPFAFVDLRELRTSLGAEAERSHLGADGLSVPGNLVWYVTQSLSGQPHLASDDHDRDRHRQPLALVPGPLQCRCWRTSRCFWC